LPVIRREISLGLIQGWFKTQRNFKKIPNFNKTTIKLQILQQKHKKKIANLEGPKESSKNNNGA